MNQKKPPIRLSIKADTALKNTYTTEYKKRVQKLEKIQEYSFSIILYWNRLEAILKVLYYYKHIEKEYPDKLNFINRNWSILKNAFNVNSDYYKTVLGDGRKSAGCLWHTRDRISHANHSIEHNEYQRFKVAIIWLIDQLLSNLSKTYEVARKDFLNHKRKSLSNVSKKI